MNKQILKHIIRYILIILIILLCIKIFKLSSENGTISKNTSTSTTKSIILLMNNNTSESEINKKIAILDPIIRKTAHASIFALLGMLTMLCLATFDNTKTKKVIVSVCFTVLFACSDELHQTFIEGRSGEFKDVCIDTIGALAGILLILLILIIIQSIKKYKENNVKILRENNSVSIKKRKLVFIASTGGHLNELMQVKSLFDKYEYHIITEKNEVDKSLRDEYGNKIKFLIYGTKKHPIRYILKFTTNCILSLIYFFRFQPEIIVTTGTHTAVPMCYIAKIFGSKVIFIETFANRTTGTVSGRLVYPIADVFVVQWEEMHEIYPKSVCWGWLY